VSGGDLLTAGSWTGELVAHPARTAAALAGLALATALASAAVGHTNRRARSLRIQVLTIIFGSLGLGALSAFVLSWLMVLEPADVGTVVGVLALTAALAAALVVRASAPLGRDVARLEATVRRIEQGDRSVTAGIDRADELGHVARALDELTHRLDQLERQRDRYEAERRAVLTSVSHDLRTPLAALRAAVEALIDGVAADRDRYLRSIQRDVAALASLIDDLFLVTQLENGRYDLPRDPVDLTEVADEAIEALTPVAAVHQVTLALERTGRVRVPGNAAALGRVIRNLLDNAIHHAPLGSTVTVAVHPGERPVVRISDEGPGFDPAFAAHAFDSFTRADPSRNRDTGGAGLGLAIARGIVQAHGGHIWIDTAPGGRVAFELPSHV
jgi:signal transduction histidine kinase